MARFISGLLLLLVSSASALPSVLAAAGSAPARVPVPAGVPAAAAAVCGGAVGGDLVVLVVVGLPLVPWCCLRGRDGPGTVRDGADLRPGGPEGGVGVVRLTHDVFQLPWRL